MSVSGRVTPGNARVRVELNREAENTTVVRVTRGRNGRWHISAPARRTNNLIVTAFIPRFEGARAGSYGANAWDQIAVKVGRRILPPAERRARSRARLLYEKGAVGMSPSDLRQAVGAPDHTQDIAGQQMWYYELAGNLIQVVFANGVVVQINRY